MIRIICRESDLGEVANVQGGQPYSNMKSFDVDLPEVEAWLKERLPYGGRSFLGIEIIKKDQPNEKISESKLTGGEDD